MNLTEEERVAVLRTLIDLSPESELRFTLAEIELLYRYGDRELAGRLWREWHVRNRVLRHAKTKETAHQGRAREESQGQEEAQSQAEG